VFNRRRRKPDEAQLPQPTLEGGTVTDMKSQTRDPERVSIFIDGSFSFGIALEIALAEGVRVGEVLDAERVKALVAKDEVGRATGSALNLLARRPRSSQEVRTRLRQKGFAEPAIDQALERLENWHYVDDADFARYWVENREANRPRGRRLLEQELRHKGVDREIARSAIDAAEPDEFAAALELATGKARSYANLEPQVARRRLAGFLGRRGYGFDVIGPVLQRVFGEQDEDRGSTDDEDSG
jgi:regulatory protein